MAPSFSQPQKFENKEIGVKWNINPRLIYTAAAYDLNRTNVPLPDPNNPGFFIPSGSNRIRGFETDLNGYVTAEWQSKFGYAYTDARVTSNTSATIVAGNRVQLVPLQSVLVVEQVPVYPGLGGIGRRHLFLGLVRLVRRFVSGYRASCASTSGILRDDQRDLEGAAQRRERLQQRVLGFGGRQQQHLTGAGAGGPADRHRQVLSAIATVPAGAGLKDQILLLIQVAQVRLAARQ